MIPQAMFNTMRLPAAACAEMRMAFPVAFLMGHSKALLMVLLMAPLMALVPLASMAQSPSAPAASAPSSGAVSAAPSAAPDAGNTDEDEGAPRRKVNDPLEPLNRGIFYFNGALDHLVVKPVATAYDEHVPDPLKSGVGNFFANIWDLWTAANQLLQGKPSQAADSVSRVAINTFLGVVGLVDVASDLGIDRRYEDLGQTLGVWGVPAGPYIVLPVFGPSTLRDTVAFPIDSPWVNSRVLPQDDVPRYSLLTLRAVEARRSILPFTRMLDTMTVDKYVFVRDVHLQRRLNQVYDGNPPDEEASIAPLISPLPSLKTAQGQP